MEQLEIQIPDMQSTHCQMRVTNALKAIDGVTVDKIEAGQANVSLDDNIAQQVLTDAIEHAGYQVSGVESDTVDKSMKFKTNINCGGCVAGVTPSLNEAAGQGNWNVDTQSPDKILTVNNGALTGEEVVEALQKAGFTIEKIGE